ncbi:MAG: carboxymuconolactone decarboxylase family protein [Deltaproteobacteria bacterium]|nr:carboxymuconolactone decarboxylase family protein [Deltaproteobacteria bacterium]
MSETKAKDIESIYETYREYYGEVPDWVRVFGERAPEALHHYHGLRKIGVEDGVLPRKVKELVLIGINLVRRYPPGVRLNVKGALDAGCTPDEIVEVMVTAMVSGAACSLIEGPRALLDELNQRKG